MHIPNLNPKSHFVHNRYIVYLLFTEIDRVQGRTTNGEETPSMVRLTEKVMIPVEDHPNVREYAASSRMFDVMQ